MFFDISFKWFLLTFWVYKALETEALLWRASDKVQPKELTSSVQVV